MSEQTKIQPVAGRATMNGKPVFTVPAKTVINFDSGFAPKLLCDGATFTAGTACPYSCTFCYVSAQMRKQYGPNGWLTKQGVTGEHEDIVIRRANAVEIVREQLLKHPEAERRKYKVIYSSPLTDVAANMELVRETVEICKVILANTRWDIRLLSKSNLLPKIADGDWNSSMLRGEATKRIIYGVSTGTLDDNLATAFEVGTAKVSQRIKSLQWLQDTGFRTFGMICPSLPQWLPGRSEEQAYHKFASEMAEAIRADRCEHIWAEVINLRGKSFTSTVDALRGAGYGAMADELSRVSSDKTEWERYARETFKAHASLLVNQGKLRFLQYVTKSTQDWWKQNESRGAVICN